MLSTIIVQGLGGIAYTFLSLSYFRKEKRQILLMQIFSYLFFIIHYYLLSGITGAICNLIGLLTLIVIYIFEKHNLKNKVPIATFLIVLLLAVNIATFQNIFSIFPIIASTIVIISFLDNNENVIRAIGIVSAICWLIYAIVYKSYISLVFEAITFIDVVIAFFKNSSHKKNSKL